MTATPPLVTVMMPTLNSARTIRLALDSIRRQSLPAEQIEILVTDGGSTDDTRTIAASYGAIVLENTRVQPEYGHSVGLSNARGRYGVFLDSDEVLVDPRSFEKKVRLLEDHENVHNVVTAGLRNPPGYPAIGDYVNRFGDPFSLFMHRIDSGDHWGSYLRHYRVVERGADWIVVQFGPHDSLPLVDAAGHFFRLDYLRTIADVHDHRIVPRLFVTMAREHRRLAVVRGDFIEHHSTAAYRTAKAKIEWRIVGNIHGSASGSAGFVGREADQPRAFRMKKYLFIPYALSIAGPALDATVLSLRYRNPAMLFHLPLAVGAGVSILKHTALKALGVEVRQRKYGQ